MKPLLALLLMHAVVVAMPGATSWDLCDGVFIAHHAPSLEYTDVPPEGGWGEALQNSADAIHGCEDQNNRIDVMGIYAMWFVVCAWHEDKMWRTTEFGITGYPADLWVFEDSGPCYPGGIGGLEIYTANFPHGDPPGGPSGVIFGPEASEWSGNFVPVWYFNGYAYGTSGVTPTMSGSGQIALGVDPSTDFGGWYNCEIPPWEFAAGCFGALGLNEDGAYCCPPPVEMYACCYEDGACEVLTEFMCQYTGGTWHFVTTCYPNPCPQPPTEQVCCFDNGSCQLLFEDDCETLGGTWHPEEPGCDPNPCPPPVGACCVGEGMEWDCYDTTEEECWELGGDAWFEGIYCEPCNPCPVGTRETTWGSIKAM